MDSIVGSSTNVLGLKMGASCHGRVPKQCSVCVLSEVVFKLVVSRVHGGQEEVSLHSNSSRAMD